MRKMRRYFVLCFVLSAFFFCLGAAEESRAEERTVYLENGQMAEDGEEEIGEEGFYQAGDTGEIRLGYGDEWLYGPLERTEYVSSDPSVVKVEGNGRFQVAGGGRAVVTVKGYNSKGLVVFHAGYCFRCRADVSGAALQKTELRTYIINWQADAVTAAFVNMPDLTYHTFQYISSNPAMDIDCILDPHTKTLKIYSSGSGTTVLSITINNMTFTLKVIATEVSINKVSAVLTSKKTAALKIKGYPGRVTWKTTKNKVAAVTSKGIVKAKKTGNAVVYAIIDGKRIGCAVSVVTPKLKKVINAAKKIARGKYSQPKRMKKGYYDCSSLVWRSYKKIGKTFGDRSYAPVAANMAKYLFGRKKRIQGGLNSRNIQGMKLRPGDLMFETGAKNGRYKGIYHVEMFVGYQCEGFDSKGKPILGTLWAARPANAYYGHPMGRP